VTLGSGSCTGSGSTLLRGRGRPIPGGGCSESVKSIGVGQPSLESCPADCFSGAGIGKQNFFRSALPARH